MRTAHSGSFLQVFKVQDIQQWSASFQGLTWHRVKHGMPQRMSLWITWHAESPVSPPVSAEWLHCLARRLQGRTSPLGPISMASPNICRHTFPQGMGDLEWKGPKGRAVLDAVVSNRRSGEKDRLNGNINWKICEILLSLCYTFSTWAMLPVANSSTLAMWLLQLPQFGRAKTHVVTLAIKLPDVVHLLWLTEVVV